MICAMVLAAGRSRRMGTQKLLLPYRGQALVAQVVDELLRSPVDQVFVVTGKDGRPILEALAGRRVHSVTNAHAENEMLHSVRCGLIAMPEEAAAAMVALGDQPSITADLVAKLEPRRRDTDGLPPLRGSSSRWRPALQGLTPLAIDYRPFRG